MNLSIGWFNDRPIAVYSDKRYKMIKKLAVLLALAVLVSSLTLTAFAADVSVSLSDTSPEKGDVITLAVSLSDCKKANTVGVSVSYDTNVLELTDESKWLISGVLSDVDISTGRAVLACEDDKTEINGEVLNFVFEVKSDYEESSISIEVIAKSDSDVIATLDAIAEITYKASEEAEEPTDEPTDEHTDEPIDEPTDEPSDEPTDEPTDEPIDEPTDEPTEETPAPETEDEPADDSAATEKTEDAITATETEEGSKTLPIIVSCVIALALAGGITVFLAKKKKK